MWITTFDLANELRGEIELTDQTVAAIYKSLSRYFRQEGLLPPSQKARFEILWKTGVVNAASGALKESISFLARKRRYLTTEFIGVLRSLNSSLELWSEVRNSERGYIEYLLENIGANEQEAECMAGDRMKHH